MSNVVKKGEPALKVIEGGAASRHPGIAPDLVPARMVNEFAYCPRLFYLEWVQGEFEDNYFTVHGRSVHRRADEPSGKLPAPAELAEDDPLRRLRSVMLSSEREGVIAKIDVVETSAGCAEPVEFKRGKPAPVPERVWEPERVQLCVQGLILRDQGYRCDRGWIYFAGSRERVEVVFDDALVARTRSLVAELRLAAVAEEAPPPLENSPKCKGCSLTSICLPDEVHFLSALKRAEEGAKPRMLLPPREDALPLYVDGHGRRVGLSGRELVVRDRDRSTVATARLEHTSQVCVFGNVQISTQAVRELCNREIPICYFSSGGWFYGRTDGIGHKNVELRIAQYQAAADRYRSMQIARTLVASKILNCRTLLRRNSRGDKPKRALRDLRHLAKSAELATEIPTLLGIEGTAARVYFENFGGMLKRTGIPSGEWAFDWTGRNRRPPTDPVNAMLSFVYSLLTKDCSLATLSAGFDPYLGFYHQPRYGRPALALDVMEEFRPLVADSVVLTAINKRIVSRDDFLRTGQSVALKKPARKRLIQAYEQRMDELITHPVFGYRIGYRRVLHVQARLMGRFLLGEIANPPEFRTR